MHYHERQCGNSFLQNEMKLVDWFIFFLWSVHVAGQYTPKIWINREDGLWLFCWHPKPSSWTLAFYKFLNRNLDFQIQEPISHGPMLCGTEWLMSKQGWPLPLKLLHMQQLRGGLVLLLLSGRLSTIYLDLFAWETTRSLLPYVDAFTKLVASHSPWNLNFAGEFVQNWRRPGEGYVYEHIHVWIYLLPCRTASSQKCCFHGNKAKTTEYWKLETSI